MIYLIEYDPKAGKIATFRDFEAAQRREAENERLQIELELNRKKLQHEVVLLEAESKDALHRTHERYFGDLQGMLNLWLKSRESMIHVDPPSAAD